MSVVIKRLSVFIYIVCPRNKVLKTDLTGLRFCNNIVITMSKSHKHPQSAFAPLQVAIRPIGNSKGVVIPKVILEQSGIEQMVEMTIDGERIILAKPKNMVRENWARDAQQIAQQGEKALDLWDFSNEEDGDWVW